MAVLLLVLFAAPISAAAGTSTLSNVGVSPRSGTTATTIVVTVLFKNSKGWHADRVTARIGGVDKAMTRVPGGSWGTGVTFRWSGTLPVGSHAVVIASHGKGKSDASLAAGTVTISAVPKATPKPTPKPTPRPTPRPTPKPTPKPRATARPTARPTVAPRRTAAPTVGPRLAPTQEPATPAPTPVLTAAPTPDPTPTEAPTATPTATPTASPSALPLTAVIVSVGSGPTSPGPNSPADPAGTGGSPNGGWSPLGSVLALAGLHAPNFTGLSLAPTLVTTTGAVALGMAFGLFGRKRRDDEGDDLSAAAASGVGFMPGAAMAVGAMDGIAAASGAVLDMEDSEALLPRWRRPSLLQARKADPIRDNEPAPRLTFDHGLVGPLDGRERKVIRYRVVRLLDSPDELRGSEIGYLDQGDEVQLLAKYGAYWLVVSPDGQQGWLHKMVLGDVYEDDAPPSDGPVATMPIAAETWTMGESDIDGDVFEAYLESRRRRGD